MIYSATVKELKKGQVHPHLCRILVTKGRIPFGCKKKIDVDARKLQPNEDLMKEYIKEFRRFKLDITIKEGALEKAFNITHFETRYRRQILSDSDSITLIRRIKKEHQDAVSWPMGICIVAEWPDKYPIFVVLESLIKSTIGDQ
jgi:hypothetical protein